jgi:hypothetical protein
VFRIEELELLLEWLYDTEYIYTGRRGPKCSKLYTSIIRLPRKTQQQNFERS